MIDGTSIDTRMKSMKVCIGTKIVSAVPMSRGDYNKLRGWEIPKDEDAEDAGFYIEYPDGYKSWSPAKQFMEAYERPDLGMKFGHAVEFSKLGKKIARTGWNGKNQFVVLMPELKLPPHSCQEPGAKVNDRTARFIGEDTPLDSQPYFALFNAQGKWQPGWVPSISDCLAEDWIIVE